MKVLRSSAILISLVVTTVAEAQDASLEPNYPARYMGGDAELITAPNGGIVYDKALEAANKVWYTAPTVDKLGDGIWVIGGYSIVNCIVIEAPEGLIVYDTGDFDEEGKHFREIIEEKISTDQGDHLQPQSLRACRRCHGGRSQVGDGHRPSQAERDGAREPARRWSAFCDPRTWAGANGPRCRPVQQLPAHRGT